MTLIRLRDELIRTRLRTLHRLREERAVRILTERTRAVSECMRAFVPARAALAAVRARTSLAIDAHNGALNRDLRAHELVASDAYLAALSAHELVCVAACTPLLARLHDAERACVEAQQRTRRAIERRREFERTDHAAERERLARADCKAEERAANDRDAFAARRPRGDEQ